MEVNKVIHANCLEVLKTLPDNYFDSCVTDPPYGISFMNKHWDYDVPKVEVWQEVLRVLKPGGYILCACGTRTQHRMAVNIEDAGFEIRDVITWHYGSGFPKSLDISKAIDKQAGVEREIIGFNNYTNQDIRGGGYESEKAKTKERLPSEITQPATAEAKQWQGWGTALKPATEFWTLARKPISENTVAENVLKWGTGGINIDGSRIKKQDGDRTEYGVDGIPRKTGNVYGKQYGIIEFDGTMGRFPANLILDEFMGQELDKQSGVSVSVKGNVRVADINNVTKMNNSKETQVNYEYDDIGGASRFFYCAKADNFERNKGLKGFDLVESKTTSGLNSPELREERGRTPLETKRQNHHPTVKPIDLMRYLVKLITPKGGTVLDPYCGSGTTCIGAKLELINYIGIEMDAEYCKIAEARIAAWNPDKYKPQTLFT